MEGLKQRVICVDELNKNQLKKLKSALNSKNVNESLDVLADKGVIKYSKYFK